MYDAYRARPTAQWAAIALDDGAVVALVNLRVLGDILGASAASLVETRDRTGSWVDAYRALARR